MIRRLLLILSAGWLLFYWGWCWGWWGSENIILRWVLQCATPRFTEGFRYPKRVDVLVSACDQPYVTFKDLSPSGRFLLVGHAHPNIISGETYTTPSDPDTLVDLQTQKRYTLDSSRNSGFVTDAYLYQGRPAPALVDWRRGVRISLKSAQTLRGARDTSGEWIWNVALQPFRASQKVILAGVCLYGLAPDPEHSDQNYFLCWDKNIVQNSEFFRRSAQLEQMLADNHIPVEKRGLGCSRYEVRTNKCYSRSGNLVVGPSGIVPANSTPGAQPVTEHYSVLSNGFYYTSWVYDDSGVVLNQLGAYVIGGPSFLHFLRVPQPILKLKVPETYLSPEALEREHAHQRLEAIGTGIAWGVPLTVGAVIGVAWWQRRKKAKVNQS